MRNVIHKSHFYHKTRVEHATQLQGKKKSWVVNAHWLSDRLNVAVLDFKYHKYWILTPENCNDLVCKKQIWVDKWFMSQDPGCMEEGEGDLWELMWEGLLRYFKTRTEGRERGGREGEEEETIWEQRSGAGNEKRKTTRPLRWWEKMQDQGKTGDGILGKEKGFRAKWNGSDEPKL